MISLAGTPLDDSPPTKERPGRRTSLTDRRRREQQRQAKAETTAQAVNVGSASASVQESATMATTKPAVGQWVVRSEGAAVLHVERHEEDATRRPARFVYQQLFDGSLQLLKVQSLPVVAPDDAQQLSPRAADSVGSLRRHELQVDVTPAGVKGLGAFAAEDAAAGTWLFDYHGDIINAEEWALRYPDTRAPAEYVHRSLFDGLAIDAQHSTHASRYVNHAPEEACNVEAVHSLGIQDSSPPRFGLAIAFHAKRPIERGDELTLDYGKEFWAARPWVTPSAGVT